MLSSLLSVVVLAVVSPTVVAPEVVSTGANEYNLNTSSDGGRIVFARSEAGFKHAHIMTVERLPTGDLVARPVSFSDPRWSDSDPQISPDGSTLWFISDRATADRPDKEDFDLWRAKRTAAGWGDPEPVPGASSPAMELGPELRGGVLYFNSSRAGGPGKLDIYAANPEGDGFAAPQPLTAPINSPFNEGDFTLSPDGRVALFWSDRPGGLGQGDIYASVRRGEGWSEPVNLGPEVNSSAFDFTPSFSPDGGVLFFSSTRPRGGADQLSDVYAVPVDSVPALKAMLGAR